MDVNDDDSWSFVYIVRRPIEDGKTRQSIRWLSSGNSSHTGKTKGLTVLIEVKFQRKLIILFCLPFFLNFIHSNCNRLEFLKSRYHNFFYNLTVCEQNHQPSPPNTTELFQIVADSFCNLRNFIVYESVSRNSGNFFRNTFRVWPSSRLFLNGRCLGFYFVCFDVC
jgi:hypothetical protein